MPDEPTDHGYGDDDGDTSLIPNAFEIDPHDSPTRSAPINHEQESFDAFDEEWEAAADDVSGVSAQSDASDWELTGADEDEEDAEPTRMEAAPPAPRGPIDDTELLELSATTVAADLDMDWDEDEAQTTLRDEADPSWGAPSPFGQAPPEPAGSEPPPPIPSVFPSGRPSPFPVAHQPMRSEHPGMPSPFGGSVLPRPSASASFPPVTDDALQGGFGGFEEEATRIMTSQPPPAVETQVDSAWPAAEQPNRRVSTAALAVAATVLVALGAYAWLQPSGSATVTLVTQPVDAEVSVDGRPLTGQTSPFTLQGLSPDMEHEIEISRDGYTTHTASFNVSGGEVKALPEVQLAPARVDTGFALDSVPTGARVFVDGEAVEGTTPVRLSDLSSGLHRIRLEHQGYEPWQTQIALVDGQMIDLPVAALATATAVPGGARRAMAASVGDRAPARAEVSRSKPRAKASRQVAKRSSSSSSSSSRAKPRAKPRAKSRSKPRFATVAAPAPRAKATGSQGTLRINSRPWSQVFVDGRFIGNTPQLNIPLPAGKHKVKLVNSDMGLSKRMRVNVQAGKATTKVVNLIE